MDMSTESIEVYKILTSKNFSDAEAIKFIRYLDSAQKEGLATNEGLTKVKSDLKEDISRLDHNIASLRGEMFEMKSDTLKWVGGMFVAQAGVIVALIKLL